MFPPHFKTYVYAGGGIQIYNSFNFLRSNFTKYCSSYYSMALLQYVPVPILILCSFVTHHNEVSCIVCHFQNSYKSIFRVSKKYNWWIDWNYCIAFVSKRENKDTNTIINTFIFSLQTCSSQTCGSVI